MNILVIPSWYPNGTDKLMGIYHKEFCEALSKDKNINVNMLYVDRQRLNAPIKYLFMNKDEVVKEKGYNVYIKKMLDVHKINDEWQIKRYCKTLDKLFKKYLKENPKPDVIHAHVTLPAGYAACVLGKKYNTPVVVTEHASYYKRFFEGKNKKYGDFVLKNAKFTTVSNYMAKEINKDCSIIPNLVDTEVFKKKRNKVKGLKLITVSALRQGKRIDDIIAALKLIVEKENLEDVKLTIVGDGFLEDYYKKRCQELGMNDYVEFTGRMNNKEEVANILIKNNIFVIASEMETFCIPGVEALASGLPVVSTKCLGPEEYIDESCGKLVEVGNINDLAKAIIDVYNNIDNYDVNYLRSVADKFSRDTVRNIALDIYKEVRK